MTSSQGLQLQHSAVSQLDTEDGNRVIMGFQIPEEIDLRNQKLLMIFVFDGGSKNQ